MKHRISWISGHFEIFPQVGFILNLIVITNSACRCEQQFTMTGTISESCYPTGTYKWSTAGFDPAASACEADVLPNELRPQIRSSKNRLRT